LRFADPPPVERHVNDGFAFCWQNVSGFAPLGMSDVAQLRKQYVAGFDD
jgi:hypothetical protein